MLDVLLGVVGRMGSCCNVRNAAMAHDDPDEIGDGDGGWGWTE